MSLKEKITKYFADSYMEKYKDRITQNQGTILKIDVKEKSVLGIYHKLLVEIVLKPDMSKTIVRCSYKKARWFKLPEFMTLRKGDKVLIQALKSKKDTNILEVMNIFNLTTKKQLVEGATIKTVRSNR